MALCKEQMVGGTEQSRWQGLTNCGPTACKTDLSPQYQWERLAAKRVSVNR